MRMETRWTRPVAPVLVAGWAMTVLWAIAAGVAVLAMPLASGAIRWAWAGGTLVFAAAAWGCILAGVREQRGPVPGEFAMVRHAATATGVLTALLVPSLEGILLAYFV